MASIDPSDERHVVRRFCAARLRFAGLIATATVVAGVTLLLGERTPKVAAVPHTISTSEHPFDPDWLEVQLILRHKCNGCHRPGTEQYDFTSYEALMKAGQDDDMPAIMPGSTMDSYVWDMVAWNAKAVRDCEYADSPMMPQDKHEWLTAGQLATLKRWIENGALEYRLPPTCDVRPLLETDFPSAKECKACHPKQYDEWSRSMHHYAMHSPAFEAFNLTLQERTGGTMGTFCTRCHSPLGTALGENGLRRNVHRSRLSMEGVSCVVCHRQSARYHKSNARQYIQPGELMDTCMYGPFDDPADVEGSHPATKQPYIKTSAFCGSCHDVLGPTGVRLEEAFSEWQNSPAARQGITCQHCHMGPVQGIPIPEHERPLGRAAEVPGVAADKIPLRHLTDHTFAGPDYSLLPDTEFPHKLDWMYEKDYRCTHELTPYEQKTLQELRRSNRRHLQIAKAKRLELLSHAAELRVDAPQRARCGERIHIVAEVLNKVAGHSFPTGFTAERQLWVEITVRNPRGNVIFASGDQDKNGDLRDSHSHAVEKSLIPYDKHLLSFQNKFIALTQKGTERSVVLSVNRHLMPLNFIRPAIRASNSFGRPPGFRIAKGSLPPLESISKKYPVTVPAECGVYTVDVKLNSRHLPPVLMDEIGAAHLKHLLEIVVIDQCHQRIVVSN